MQRSEGSESKRELKKIMGKAQKRKDENMKKMKRFFALFLAMAMVLGMSMTVFAEPATNGSAKIKVSGIAVPDAAKGIGTAKVEYVKIITPDPSTTTKWAFTETEYGTAYAAAYGATDAQAAIEGLIAEKKASADGYTADASKARLAISATSEQVASGEWNVANAALSAEIIEWDVTDDGPGLYIVKITQSGYNYIAMAAYVGFDEVQVVGDNYVYPSMTDGLIVAKGGPLVVTKSNTDDDKVVAVGDTVTYTIETTVPYIDPNEVLESATYVVRDEISGAEYTNLDQATFGYKSADGAITPISGLEIKANGNKFDLDLSSLIDAQNTNANKTVVITYTAKVTAVDGVTNTAEAGHGSGDDFEVKYGTGDDKVFSGDLQITKTGVDDDATGLANAEFEVRKADENGVVAEDAEALTFTVVTKTDGSVDYYKYDPNGTVTNVVTGSNGIAKIKGLDIGYYSFKEVVAPDGYTINATDANGEVKLVDGKQKAEKAADITAVNATMADTKISALPSTGGIGTTIFTVGGCAIMILAAGMFFVSRRRAAK